MWKTILKQVGVFLFDLGLDLLVSVADTNKDGKISKSEITALIKRIETKIKKN